MAHEAQVSSQRNSERFKRRLAVFSRYAAIVQAQFIALKEEDISRFSELAGGRQEIQKELDASPQDIPGDGELDQEGDELLKGVQQELEEVLVLDKEIQNQLIRFRGELGTQLKAMNKREGSVKQYLTREEQTSQERPSRLNVRL